ncbi:MAG: hypothetical protein PVF43_09235 [Candidatus Eiseniibacteriota bacterium]|jgi:hypothetical protein
MSTIESGSPAPDDTDALIEQATSAYRELAVSGRIQPSPAWADLTPAQCETLFARQMASRRLERALDAGGCSSTARVVLARLARIGQLAPDDGVTGRDPIE